MSLLCLLGNFACFFSFADFLKIDFFTKLFQEILSVSNSLENVVPGLGPNFLQSQAADDTSRQRLSTKILLTGWHDYHTINVAFNCREDF